LDITYSGTHTPTLQRAVGHIVGICKCDRLEEESVDLKENIASENDLPWRIQLQ